MRWQLAATAERPATAKIRPSAEAPVDPQVWNVRSTILSGCSEETSVSGSITWHEYVALCCPDADLEGPENAIGEPCQKAIIEGKPGDDGCEQSEVGG